MPSENTLAAARMVARAFERETDGGFRSVVEAYLDSPYQGESEEAQTLATRGARKLQAALSAREQAADQAEWDDYLDASYADLFLGVAPGSMVPQESVYYSAEKVTHQKPFFEVCDLMADHGYAKPHGCVEPEDCLGLEWLFYLHLLERDANAAASFKAAHMDNWMPQALQAIAEADDIGYYAGMANIARALLADL